MAQRSVRTHARAHPGPAALTRPRSLSAWPTSWVANWQRGHVCPAGQHAGHVHGLHLQHAGHVHRNLRDFTQLQCMGSGLTVSIVSMLNVGRWRWPGSTSPPRTACSMTQGTTCTSPSSGRCRSISSELPRCSPSSAGSNATIRRLTPLGDYGKVSFIKIYPTQQPHEEVMNL